MAYDDTVHALAIIAILCGACYFAGFLVGAGVLRDVFYCAWGAGLMVEMVIVVLYAILWKRDDE